jgi:hypothetical protein
MYGLTQESDPSPYPYTGLISLHRCKRRCNPIIPVVRFCAGVYVGLCRPMYRLHRNFTSSFYVNLLALFTSNR